jgi:hypothetical protein
MLVSLFPVKIPTAARFEFMEFVSFQPVSPDWRGMNDAASLAESLTEWLRTSPGRYPERRKRRRRSCTGKLKEVGRQQDAERAGN